MPIYIFHTKAGGKPYNLPFERDAIQNAEVCPDVVKIEFAPTGKIIWEREPFKPEPKFKIGDKVRKIKGSQWQGKVVGTYSTELTPEGYVIESESHAGSCQIYPASALEAL